MSHSKDNKKTVLYPGIQQLCQVLIVAVLVLLLITLPGCSKRYGDMPAYLPFESGNSPNRSVGRFKTSYLAQQIDAYYQGMNPGPIGVTSLVNLDDLTNSSSFGRMFGEQLISELAMMGYDVIELRHADALHFMADSGEFALSRDIAFLRQSRDLSGLVVGTYTESPVRIYVNARLIDPSTSRVLSAGSVEMAKTQELARMLRGGRVSPTLERIPVKQLGVYSYPVPFQSQRNTAIDREEMSGMDSGFGAPLPQMMPMGE